MAYNAYNYSPYFQQTNQQTSNSGNQSYPEHQRGTNAPYRTHQAPPTGANHSTQHAYSTDTPSYSYSNAHSYPVYGRSEPSRDGLQNTPVYHAPSSRPQVDTSASGSLAYVSALGRNSPSVEHAATSQRTLSPGQFTASPTQGTSSTRRANPPSVNDLNTTRAVNNPQQSGQGANSGRMNPTAYSVSSPYPPAIAASALAEPQRQSLSQTEMASVPTSAQTSHTNSARNNYFYRLRNESVDHQQYESRQAASSNFHGNQRSTQDPVLRSDSPYQRQNSYQHVRQELRAPPPPQNGARSSSTLQPATSTSEHINHLAHSYASHISNQQPKHDHGDYRNSSKFVKDSVAQGVSADCVRCLQMRIKCSGRQGDGEACQNCKNSHVAPGGCQFPKLHSPRLNSTRSNEEPANQAPADNVGGNGPKVVLPSIQNQHPMTVDPNQVFNQHEYQRRKKIAEAEAQAAKQTEKRRLEEAQQKIRSDTSEPANGNTGGRVTGSSGLEGVSFQQSRAPRPSSTDSAGGATNESKEKREAELKALFGSMFGQMRELKAKDPAMFLEIWEEFKKGQPPINSSSKAPQPVKETATSPPNANNAGDVISPIISDNGQLASTDHISDQQPLAPQVTKQLLDSEKLQAQRGKGQSKVAGDQSRMPTQTKAMHSADSLAERVTNGPNHNPIISKPMTTTQPTSEGSHPSNQSLTSSDPRSYSRGPESSRQATHPTHNFPRPHNVEQRPASINVSLSMDTPSTSTPVSQLSAVLGPQNLPTQSSWGTMWPEKYKFSLAVAARTEILSEPMNSATGITHGDIVKLLNLHPSFSQLCEALEARGLVLDWKRFAQALLAVVPSNTALDQKPVNSSHGREPVRTSDISSQNSLGNSHSHSLNDTLPSTSRPISQGSAKMALPAQQVLHQPTSGLGTRDPNIAIRQAPKTQNIERADTRIHNANSMQGYLHAKTQQGQSLPSPEYLMNRAQQGFSLDKASLPNVHNQILQDPNQKPSSKAEMARKRSFNEIVDLTQESSGDEMSRPMKQARIEELRNGEWLPFTHQTSPLTPLESPANPKMQPSGTVGEQPASTAGLSQHKISAQVLSAREKLRFKFVIRPLDKSKALRRNDYDARTLARDVLISVGKHRTERPLNWHLINLPHSFRYVNPHSDLSTFRWDLVDLGGPSQIPSDAAIAEGQDADDEADAVDLQTGGHSQIFVRRPQLATVTSLDGNVHVTGLGNDDSTRTVKNITIRGRGRPRGRPQLSRPLLSRPLLSRPLLSRPLLSRPLLSRDMLQQHAPNVNQTNEGFGAPRRLIGESPGLFIFPSGRGRGRGSGRGSGRGNGRGGGNSGLGRDLDGARLNSHHADENVNRQPLPLGSSIAPNSENSESQLQVPSISASQQRQAASNAPSGNDVDLSQMGAGVSSSDARQDASGDASQNIREDSRPDPPQNIRQDAPQDARHNDNTDRPSSILQIRMPTINNQRDTPERRRGRPPGSVNKPKPPQSTGDSNTPRRRGRPPGSTKSSTPGSSQLRGMRSSEGVAIMVPSPSPASNLSVPLSRKRAGTSRDSTKKTKSREEAEQPSSPSYRVYKCSWKGCTAELHNLDTLRRHVFKLHCKKGQSREIPCLWFSCGNKQHSTIDLDGMETWQPDALEFAPEDAWRKHIEKQHLAPLAWQLGDGPSVHPSEAEMSDYLSDAQGRQVTPLITTDEQRDRPHEEEDDDGDDEEEEGEGEGGDDGEEHGDGNDESKVSVHLKPMVLITK